MLQGHYKNGAGMLQRCYRAVRGVFHGHNTVVTGVIQECCRDVILDVNGIQQKWGGKRVLHRC